MDITSDGNHPGPGPDERPTADSSDQPLGSTRRDVMRRGAKLVFVAPLLTTFFARDAYAAASTQSCYATGHACPGAEPCCTGNCGDVIPGQCP